MADDLLPEDALAPTTRELVDLLERFAATPPSVGVAELGPRGDDLRPESQHADPLAGPPPVVSYWDAVRTQARALLTLAQQHTLASREGVPVLRLQWPNGMTRTYDLTSRDGRKALAVLFLHQFDYLPYPAACWMAVDVLKVECVTLPLANPRWVDPPDTEAGRRKARARRKG